MSYEGMDNWVLKQLIRDMAFVVVNLVKVNHTLVPC